MRVERDSSYLLSPCPRFVPASVPAYFPHPPIVRKPRWILTSRPICLLRDGPCPRVPAAVARPAQRVECSASVFLAGTWPA